MIRMIFKLLVLPIWLSMCLLSGLMDVILSLYSFCGGIFYTFLFLCLILALVSNQWTNLGILSGFMLGAIILTVFVGALGAIIEVWKVRLKIFLDA